MDSDSDQWEDEGIEEDDDTVLDLVIESDHKITASNIDGSGQNLTRLNLRDPIYKLDP